MLVASFFLSIHPFIISRFRFDKSSREYDAAKVYQMDVNNCPKYKTFNERHVPTRY